MDEALASNNVSRAIYEWREAYGAAMGSRRAEALASVGDAALRIDTLAGSRSVFREEARDAYRGSMLLAHAQRDVRTLMQAADSLAQLGDTRAAERARHMVRRIGPARSPVSLMIGVQPPVLRAESPAIRAFPVRRQARDRQSWFTWLLIATALVAGAVIAQSRAAGVAGAERAVLFMAIVFSAALISSIAGFAFSALAGAALAQLSLAPTEAIEIMPVCSIALQSYCVCRLGGLDRVAPARAIPGRRRRDRSPGDRAAHAIFDDGILVRARDPARALLVPTCWSTGKDRGDGKLGRRRRRSARWEV